LACPTRLATWQSRSSRQLSRSRGPHRCEPFGYAKGLGRLGADFLLLWCDHATDIITSEDLTTARTTDLWRARVRIYGMSFSEPRN
jgi:hypothetical protein